MKNATFVLLSSATVHEPRGRAHRVTGIFDSVGGHHEWAKIYGADVIRRKSFDYSTGRPVIQEILKWRGGKSKQRHGVAANEWFRKQGLYIRRKKELPPGMVDSAFLRKTVDEKWVTLLEQVEGAYIAAAKDELDPQVIARIGMHRVNAIKRILESSKVEHAIARTREPYLRRQAGNHLRGDEG